MAMDGKLLSRARDRLAQARHARELALERKRTEVYARLPRVEQIDRLLAQSFAKAAAAALDAGANAEEAVRLVGLESLSLQAERAELLVGAGYTIDVLDEQYDCPRCRDHGYVGTKPCACLLKLYDEEQTKELSKLLKLGGQTFDSFRLDYYDDRPDASGSSPRAKMEMVYETCLLYARRFGSYATNLLMTGAPGLGKTFLSACIAREVSGQGYSVVYDTAISVFERFEQQKFSRNVDEEAREDLARYFNCDLLILDDLGTEMTTSFTTSALYDLVNTRLTSERRTIINTNLSPAELRTRYTPQIASRLEGEYLVMRFYGRDIRQLKRDGK